jgi:2'-5' RNA ligase
VSTALAGIGFAPEARAFQPHLTVGRVRAAGGPVDRGFAAALAAPLAPSPPVGFERLALVRSHLSPAGSRYEDLAAWTLPHA